MTTLLLITGSLLLLIVLGLVYRIITLVGIAKGSSVKGVGMSNKVNAALFPIFFFVGFGALFWYSGVAQEYFLPEAASVHGKETDFLFWLTIAIVGLAFFITHILLFFFPFVYQYKEKGAALYYPDNDKLEIAWTIVPAVVMTLLVVSGWWVWTDLTAPAPSDSMQIEIVGKQFNWYTRYPGKDGSLGTHDYRKIDATNALGVDYTDPNSMDDFMPREIRLPKGQNVQLKIRSRDVLHSVFMPHFRVKMDAVPGMPTSFWFTPTISTAEMREKTGNPDFNYELACTEVCGTSHYAMRMVIVVEEPEEFEAWFNEQEPWAARNKEYLSSIGIELEEDIVLSE